MATKKSALKLVSVIAILANSNSVGGQGTKPAAVRVQEDAIRRIYSTIPDEKWRFNTDQGRSSVTGVLVKDFRDGGDRLVQVDGDPCRKTFFYFKNPDVNPTGEKVRCGNEQLDTYRVIAKK